MAHDFRTIAEAVKRTVKEMDQRDSNWKWKATITKKEVRIFWSYLEFRGNTPPFIITDGSPEKEECNSEENDFIVLRNERGYYMNGAILGAESWQDGDLEKAVVNLMEWLQRRVNHTY